MAEDYLKSPLLVWLQTFSVESITYNDLVDGYFLNEVFQQIDTKCTLEGTVSKVEDVNDKIQNWEVLLKNIRSFYQEVLQQYIIMRPPDIFIVCYQPDCGSAKDQLDSTLLLLLGCAVQCEERESHVEVIKSLDVDVQHSIMQHIKEVTDFSKVVLNVNIPLKDIDESQLTLYTHLSNLINQRDGYIQEMKALHQALNVISIDDFGRIMIGGQWGSKGQKSKSSNRLSLINLEMSKLVGQAEYKALLRKLKQELLDKGDLVVELEDELELLKKDHQKVKLENFDLIQQARMGKFYRDELDIYKEKAETVEKLEKELLRYKEQSVELDYLKDRVEELKVDNCVLMDSKKMLEDQAESHRQKSQHLLDVEIELLRCRKALEDSDKEQEEYKDKIKCLTQRVEQFEREKEAKKRISYMEESLYAPHDLQSDQGVVGSLADQLLQASQSQIIALEAKLQKLELEMEDKYYFSEKMLTALGLDRARIRNESPTRVREADAGGVDAFLSGDDLEREALKRVALIEDDNERLKGQVRSSVLLLEGNREKIRSLEAANLKSTTEKQQLVLSLESSDRKVKNLFEEREKLECELVELKKMANICLNRTKDLESCLEEVKAKDEAYLQEKIEFEKESRRLKSLLKDKSSAIVKLENTINEMNAQIADLKKTSEAREELEIQVHDLQLEVQASIQAGILDKKLITSLREELVTGKIQTENFAEELVRANKKCEAYACGELLPTNMRITEKMFEEKSMEVEAKERRISELEESLDETKMQAEKLQSELISLLKKEELNATKDRTLIVTQRYGQSPSATQEILKLKDNLIKTERHRDSLVQEAAAMRKQIESLKTSLNEEPPADRTFVESLQSQLQRSRTSLADLQVEHSSVSVQKLSLESQIARLKLDLSEGRSKFDCLTSERNSLEDNCRALQKLHDKLGVEYERLQEDHGTLKGVHRLIKTDLKSAKEKISSLEKNLEKLKNRSADEEATTTKEEIARLARTVKDLEGDNENLSAETRRSRLEVGRLKDSLQALQRQAAENRTTVSDLNFEMERLRRIEHMYDRTEEENQILTDQLRMYRGSMQDGGVGGVDCTQQQQKSLIERLAEIKNKSSKNENQSTKTKKKIKSDATGSLKRNQSVDQEKREHYEAGPPISRKDYVLGSPMRKSQEDFLSIEDAPNRSECKSASQLENSTRFGDWKIKTVFRKNKSIDTAQQTNSPFERRRSKKDNAIGCADEETITLNQFLSECNQSPKSRRKFLIQKRIALDDEVFCERDLPLDPRPPVVFESSQSAARVKSEGNVFANACSGRSQFDNRSNTPARLHHDTEKFECGKVQTPLGVPSRGAKIRTVPNSSLHYSKSFQENESRSFYNETTSSWDTPHIKGSQNGAQDSFNPHGANFSSNDNHFQESHPGWKNGKQVNSIIGKKKDSFYERELQPKPTARRKVLAVDDDETDESCAIANKTESVPYEIADGVVKNLIISYQKNVGSPVAEVPQTCNQRELNFSKSACDHSAAAAVRPKSAGQNQERVYGKKFVKNQVSCGDNADQASLGNPKVCLVRPATASVMRTNNGSSQEDGGGCNKRPGTSNRSKVFYEYSCV